MTVAERALGAMYIAALGRDIYYRPGSTDDQVVADVFRSQYHVPPHELQPATVLDCGAHIGLTMCDYRRLWPNAEIFGVEMDAGNVAVAQLNTRDDILCAAVEDYPDDAPCLAVYDMTAEHWAYTLGDSDDAAGWVVRLPLRVVIDELGWDEVGFLKLDIEGSERSILANPAELENVQTLLVELHGYERRDALRDLRAQGFNAEPHDIHPAAVFAWRDE